MKCNDQESQSACLFMLSSSRTFLHTVRSTDFVRLHLFVALIVRDFLGLGDGAELLRLFLPNRPDGAGLGIHVRPHIQCHGTTVGHNRPEP